MKLSRDDVIEILKVGYLSPSATQLRTGQALYNHLHAVAPDIAHEINATECDPFYDNAKIGKFIEMLEKKVEEGKRKNKVILIGSIGDNYAFFNLTKEEAMDKYVKIQCFCCNIPEDEFDWEDINIEEIEFKNYVRCYEIYNENYLGEEK